MYLFEHTKLYSELIIRRKTARFLQICLILWKPWFHSEFFVLPPPPTLLKALLPLIKFCCTIGGWLEQTQILMANDRHWRFHFQRGHRR